MSKKNNHLVKKIEIFIRKYYKNQLIKGALISIALVLSFFLLLVIFEYFLRLGKTFRAIIFYSYLLSAAITLWFYILRPLAGLIRIGKRLTNVQAANIIGNHFPNISDKLLNTLQLQHDLESQNSSEAFLLEAAIEQKTEQLSPIPFHQAIRFTVNKKYLKYFIPPVIIFAILSWYSPKLITDPTDRIIHYNQEFVEQAPFQFHIQNNDLNCLQGEDYELSVEITGDIIPDEVYVVIDNYPFKIKKTNPIAFKYLFKNVLNSKSFFFQSGKHQSAIYTLNVLPFPKITSFSVRLNYPKYIGKKSETLKNVGDFIIPEGTSVLWDFTTKDISNLLLILNKDTLDLSYENKSIQSPAKRILQNTNYYLVPKNSFINTPDTLSYSIEVIKDQFPEIQVAEFRDSLDDKRVYFQGYIKDDYGTRKLLFKWKLDDRESSDFQQISIPIQENILQQKFYYFIHVDSLKIANGEAVKYYFEVWDNDGVNGSKVGKTLMQSLRKLSIQELDSARNKINDDIKDKMEEYIDGAKKINQEIEKLDKKMMDKKQMDWQDKQQLKELMNRYQKMLENIEEIQKTQKLSQQKNKELTEEDERLLEKQKQLQELFDKLMTPEMKKMMEEIQKMMEKEIDKDQAKEIMDKMQLDNKDLEKQLDRDLEIFKQMEFDQKLQEAINQLDSLKSEQDQLNKDVEEKALDTDKAAEKQEELNKKFEDFEKKLKEADQANKELEKPNNMENTQEKQDEIKKQMEESSDELKKGKSKPASKMQQSASESMKTLSEKLKKMQEDMEMESNAESMEELRDVLSNLIESSFKQENLMEEMKKISHTDPQYPELIRKQKDIKSDLKMIEDSLLAISKRQVSISPMVNKEISHINLNMDKTLASMLALNTIAFSSITQKNMAIGNQQEIMTSVNNLALMLSESLEQMKKEQMQAKSGKGSCKKPKPGQGEGSMKSIRQMQQALNEQMKKMQQKMKEGKGEGDKKGKGKPGGSGSSGEQMSEEMARMAAQQELIRKKLQAYQESLKKTGNGKEAGDLNKVAKDMEQNETELVNSLILQESILRQQEILTRLLEAETAEREQKQEERREAKEGVEQNRLNPPQLNEFLKLQNKEVELLKTIPPNMKPFYKNKVNNYFEKINAL